MSTNIKQEKFSGSPKSVNFLRGAGWGHAHVQQSEDNSQESAIFLHHVGPGGQRLGVKLGSSVSAASEPSSPSEPSPRPSQIILKTST